MRAGGTVKGGGYRAGRGHWEGVREGVSSSPSMPPTTLEIVLLSLSIAGILYVFLAELLRGRFTKLPPPVIFAIRMTLGVVFLILAVIGGLLPILQGWIFFVLAMLMLFPQSKLAIKSVDKIRARMPRLAHRLHLLGIGIHHDPDTKSALEEDIHGS